MAEQFQKRGLNARFLDAVCPDLSKGWPAIYNRKKRSRTKGYDMNQGEIGCFMSHRQAWTEFLNSEEKITCVLEDDVELDKDFENVLTILCSLAHQWDVVRLYGVFQRKDVRLLEFMPGRWLVDYFEHPRGTQGYVLNREAARRLLKHTETMHCPIDDSLDRGWQHKLRFYGIKPYILNEMSNNISTIANRKHRRQNCWRRLCQEFNRSGTNIRKKIWVLGKWIRYSIRL